jgi:hypothetical protein
MVASADAISHNVRPETALQRLTHFSDAVLGALK